ncbi:MAG TPA: hypothetical protein VMH86_05300 [Rhizomicrobium sp.]|nr:hypothetical protein [Rhizomicrobium sp.]
MRQTIMRYSWVAIGLAVLALGAGIALHAGWIEAPRVFGFNGSAAPCEVDNQIDADARAEIDRTAETFGKTFLGADPDRSLALMTDAARATTTGDLAEGLKRSTGGAKFTHIRVLRTIYMENHGTGADGHILCPVGGHRVSLFVRPGANQAHVLVGADSPNASFTLALWLLPEHGGWRVQFAHVGVSAMAGHDTASLLAMSGAEHDAGHDFNAAMLYTAAVGTSDLGNSYQDAEIGKTLRLARDRLRRPAELTGAPPFTWTLGGKDYKVGHISIEGIGGQIGLIFDLPQADWPSDQAANERGREFLNAYVAAHPEYARVFGYLLARAIKPDYSGGYATLYRRGTGLLN